MKKAARLYLVMGEERWKGGSTRTYLTLATTKPEAIAKTRRHLEAQPPGARFLESTGVDWDAVSVTSPTLLAFHKTTKARWKTRG